MLSCCHAPGESLLALARASQLTGRFSIVVVFQYLKNMSCPAKDSMAKPIRQAIRGFFPLIVAVAGLLFLQAVPLRGADMPAPRFAGLLGPSSGGTLDG